MTESETGVVATRDSTPAGLVRQYSTDFSSLLPSHVKPDQWVRLACGALKKGKVVATKTGNMYELEVAAANDVGVFLAALKDAARLGLEPGTEQYYLTPRREKGQLRILGIVGYQGLVELMYRAGAVSSVIVECVYSSDRFDYVPGRHDRPVHEIDWDSDNRGTLRLVYSYAVMRDGAVSKVVVLNRADIDRIKLKSQGANSEYSPWRTNEPAMWMKSAARQLAKWVPTSAEYRETMLRVPAAVADTTSTTASSAPPPAPAPEADTNRSMGDILDAEFVDHEEDPDAAGSAEWPPVAGPGGDR